MILALFAISCEADRTMPERCNTFKLEHAKLFHQEHATDLRLPNGGNGVKSAIDYDEILVPQWDKATYHEVQFPSKLAKTYEIPLNTGTIVGGVLLKEKGASHEKATMKSSLVIQKFSQGDKKSLRQMVVTVIGHDSKGNSNSEAFSYMGSHKTFTGFMVVSTIDGKIVNIFQYLNGVRSKVYVKRTEEAAINTPLYGFSFLKSHGTKSAYGNSEPGTCHMCGKEGQVYIQYGNICESCLEGSEFLDEIIVTPNPEYCPDCGMLEDECICNPFACDVCGHEPCICDGPDTACEYCGEIGCNGECREEGKGGGGDGGNDDSPAEGEWSGDGHRTIITNALGKILTATQLNAVIKGSKSADALKFQVVEYAFMHAMVPANSTLEAAVSSMRNYFVECMRKFKDNDNYEQFGMGIHCIQDAYCPVHDFKEWGGKLIEYLNHLNEDADDYPDKAKDAENATKAIYDKVKDSDGSDSKLGFIFDEWYEEFKNSNK